MDEIRKLAPRAGSYVWETDYSSRTGRRRSGATITTRLRAVKTKYDPDGLFFLHHGVGSEDWSADGFTAPQLTASSQTTSHPEGNGAMPYVPSEPATPRCPTTAAAAAA